ncbi:aminotransferase, class V [Rubrobacter xylanophilus DSM 9941]|uniref:Aminotransferase, class V n=1 Tax=Rubrobacter xylanophilus (strain DSM 9941 / JCM 11954 / NBRC 16129 / PRD-1) TaxID=266117 RepID=Q1AWB2_RUBXD|nr:cysteine desulfurase family protein [Rubrobacter xylanophilus]ABG04316.1 aminotransferase, class V [Rubrobacter xylanophilus DSM 9941]
MTAEKSAVYLDNAATTPLDGRVLEAMLESLEGLRGNPSALHAPGAAAREAVEEAREAVAALVGASPEEIVFTSGGTEADNLAVLGLARAAPPGRRHAVISRVEHPAVREAGRRLEAEGFEVTWLGVDGDGVVDAGAFEAALREDTALAAVMWANNEVGSVQPVEELAAACAERGIPFHADAVQAAGRLPVDVRRVPVSTLALSAHKLYGPQGAGALYVREGVEVSPLILGGGQERGLRSGTENVAAISGFGVAARLAAGELEERARRERELRDRILAGVREMEGVRLNGHPRRRLPNNVHLTVEGVEAEGLVLFLDALGYAVGSGAACSSGGHKASPVLLAMGLGEREAFSSVRITVGKDNTFEEVDGFLTAFRQAVGRLRELSPLQAG